MYLLATSILLRRVQSLTFANKGTDRRLAMPRPPLIHYSRGIHNISNGVPLSSSTNPSTAGNPSQPRMSYVERLKANGSAAKENQLSYPVPNSVAVEVSVKLTPADHEDSL